MEVIFVYRPVEGMLEVLARGGRQRVDDLGACFAAAILDLRELPPREKKKLYDLDPLLSPSLSLPTDACDGIDRVEVRELCLNLGLDQGWRRHLTFAALARIRPMAGIHEVIARTAREDGVDLGRVIVSSAKFRLVFHSVDNERPRHLTFRVGSPAQCSLKDNYHDQIARKYLYRWGIALDNAAAETVQIG